MIEVTPRELVVSLPHGLRGHVAYAEASDWLAEQSKKAAAAAAAGGGEGGAEGKAAGRKRKAPAGDAASGSTSLPPLSDLFRVGQLVRGTVVGLRAGGEGQEGGKGGGQKKRVDLSLRVSKLHAGLGREGVVEGLALTGCVKSVEDKGLLITLGVKVGGWVRFMWGDARSLCL